MSEHNLGPLPIIHEREIVVEDARRKLNAALVDIIKEFDLTTGESLRIVNQVASDWIGCVAKYTIREERHGDADKPGGLA